MVQKAMAVAARVVLAVDTHPIAVAASASGVSLGASIITVLQSAQEVMTTLTALVSSVAAVVTAVIALRALFKKPKE
jgi:hypothetical protein